MPTFLRLSMGSISKYFSLLLVVILAVSSLIIVESAFAQSIPKPSTPEFSLKYVDLSYNVPPTYGIDQYTGKTIITQDGYHVDNRSLQFTIKNQPFTSYTDPSGNQTSLYYNFRIKGAYGTEWNYYPFAPNGVTTSRYGGIFWGNNTESPADLAQSNTGYTTITIQIPGLYNVPPDAQLQVQAQALIGYMVPSDYMMAGHVYVFTGQYSDWSNTQTITISSSAPTATPNTSASSTPTSNSSTSPTQNPTATPNQFGSQNKSLFTFDSEQIVIVVFVVVAVLVLVVAVFMRRRSVKPAVQSNNESQ